jgi:uncharacterized membrane protein YuzA (DUF378 family)
MKLVKMLTRFLVVLGAINWGLWGFFQFDLVAYIFGGNTMMSARLIYSLIGIAGVLSVKCACACHKGGSCGK